MNQFLFFEYYKDWICKFRNYLWHWLHWINGREEALTDHCRFCIRKLHSITRKIGSVRLTLCIVGHWQSSVIQQFFVQRKPWSSISIVFITSPLQSKFFHAIFVVLDRLAKMMYFVPCKNAITRKHTIKHFIDNIYPYHGMSNKTL